MNTQEALKIVGGLSKPSKMPGWGLRSTSKRMQDWIKARAAGQYSLLRLLRSKRLLCFSSCTSSSIQTP